MALIIEKYLGASAGNSSSTSGQSVVTLCQNVKRELLDDFAKKPEILQTSESFLKAVLRHYKVDLGSAQVTPLLGGRAKLYFRVGRLLQAWPRHQVAWGGGWLAPRVTYVAILSRHVDPIGDSYIF